jgi:2,3-bisphosphoglycerate-dependent phosphoglycerate mutase
MNNFKLLICSNGESIWSKSNKFTGWSNINLTSIGMKQAFKKTIILKNNNLIPNKILTSKLIRSINTSEIIKNNIKKDFHTNTYWQLNERHYGMFDGMNRNDAYEKYGKNNIENIRKNFYNMPYIINNENIIDNDYLINNNYETPIGESNNMVYKRVLPFWENTIKHSLYKNEIVLIVSHKNTIRCLMKIFENLNDIEFKNTNIDHDDLILYNFDQNFNMISKFYLY